MSVRSRAFVRDERTSSETYFVYIESEFAGNVMAARFNQRRNADKVAAAMNVAYKNEGRLYSFSYEDSEVFA